MMEGAWQDLTMILKALWINDLGLILSQQRRLARFLH